MPPLDSEDINLGWNERRLLTRVQKPVEHFIAVGDKRYDLPSLICDLCNAPIADGDEALLFTQWRRETPPDWESEYTFKETK